MEFIYGCLLGAIIVFIVFGAGFLTGWALKAADIKHTQRVTATELTQEQKRRVEEEQQAWKSLHNYSVEDAYGIHRTRHPDKE